MKVIKHNRYSLLYAIYYNESLLGTILIESWEGHFSITSRVSLLASFSLRCNYSQCSTATTHLSRVMRQLQFISAQSWVNSNMVYWPTLECAHKDKKKKEKSFAHF